jgi:hypothetical protein
MKKEVITAISILSIILLVLSGCSNQDDNIKGAWQEKNDSGIYFNFLKENIFNIVMDGNIVEAGTYDVLSGSQVRITASGPALAGLSSIGSENDVIETVLIYRFIDQDKLILTDDKNWSVEFIRK